MTKEEFVKTVEVCGQKVDIGMDDYGQCFFIEWDDSEGHHEEGMGTYNLNYMSAIYFMFDKRYKELFRKDMWGDDMTEEEKSELKEYENKISELEESS